MELAVTIISLITAIINLSITLIKVTKLKKRKRGLIILRGAKAPPPFRVLLAYTI